MKIIYDCVPMQVEGKKELAKQLTDEGLNPKTLILYQSENDKGVMTYIKQKEKHSKDINAECDSVMLRYDATTDQVCQLVTDMHKNYTAVIVQLPLAPHIDARKVLDCIPYYKDCDCLTTENLGRLYSGNPLVYPATPKGVIKLLDKIDFEYEGKNVVIAGRSHIVGKPLAEMLTQKNCTVTLCHSKTRPQYMERMIDDFNTDLFISAIGKPLHFDFIENDHLVTIDCGTSANNEGKLCGDIDIKNDDVDVMFGTPVPGGIGRLTVLCLLENIVELARYQKANNLN